MADDRVFWVNLDKHEYVDPSAVAAYSYPMFLAGSDGQHDAHLSLYAMLMLDNGALATDILRDFDPDTMRGNHMNDPEAMPDRRVEGPNGFKINGRWSGDRITFLRNNNEFVEAVKTRIAAGEQHWLVKRRNSDRTEPVQFDMLQDGSLTDITAAVMNFTYDLDNTLLSEKPINYPRSLSRLIGHYVGRLVATSMQDPSGKMDLRYFTIHDFAAVATNMVRDEEGLRALRAWLADNTIISEPVAAELPRLTMRQTTPEPLVLHSEEGQIPAAAKVPEVPLFAALNNPYVLHTAVQIYQVLAEYGSDPNIPSTEWDRVMAQVAAELPMRIAPIRINATPDGERRGRRRVVAWTDQAGGIHEARTDAETGPADTDSGSA